MSYFIA